MVTLSKKNVFVAVHGHFYQPPRENPWLEVIETEESARPFHDWNERIASECYRPNAFARMVDGKGKILEIINNYSSISFNFGPTLLPWLERTFPSVYQKILEADRESLKQCGHGNAIAQVYHHIIMPLADERDKETEIFWGITDFEKRFRRKPEALWLPETAVDYSTLRVLTKYGMRYLILSPFQALKVKPFGGKKWTEVSGGRVDTTQPYRCFMKESSGKKLIDRFIDIFFYNGTISKEIAFGDLLKDGNRFCDRFTQFYRESGERPQLIHIASDGETFGHHKKFGEMALAYALNRGFLSRGLETINYGAFLKRFPPVYEVEIDEGPKGEGTSWSCAHGVGRWKEDCGCSTGGRPGWNQKWRGPLREALDGLRDALRPVFEKEGGKIFQNVWEARNGYMDVILDRSPESVKTFFERYGQKGLDGKERVKGLKLLEIQRYALQMYTSCGWFFSDLSGLETLLILQYAARAVQVAEEWTDGEIEKRFLRILSKAESNLPEMGNGDQVYRRLVKPKGVTLQRVVNHFAVSSLFNEGERKKVYAYQVERIQYERMDQGEHLLVMGQVRVVSDSIPEPKEFLFGLFSIQKEFFRTWVSEPNPVFSFNQLKEKGREALKQGREEVESFLYENLGQEVFGLQDLFQDEKKSILEKLIQTELDEYDRGYADLFDRTKQIVETLAHEGLEIPYEIRVGAEIALSYRLLQEVNELKKDMPSTIKKGEIDRIVEEAEEHGYQLRKEKSLLVLNDILQERINALQKSRDLSLSDQSEKIGEIITLLDMTGKWKLNLSLESAQDIMKEMLDECVGEFEKCLWEGGTSRPFPPNLISLAEKLGFNVERFLKMSGPEGRL